MGKGGFEKDLPGELAFEKRPEGYIGGRSGCMGERISDSEKLKCQGGQSLARTFHLDIFPAATLDAGAEPASASVSHLEGEGVWCSGHRTSAVLRDSLLPFHLPEPPYL